MDEPPAPAAHLRQARGAGAVETLGITVAVIVLALALVSGAPATAQQLTASLGTAVCRVVSVLDGGACPTPKTARQAAVPVVITQASTGREATTTTSTPVSARTFAAGPPGQLVVVSRAISRAGDPAACQSAAKAAQQADAVREICLGADDVVRLCTQYGSCTEQLPGPDLTCSRDPTTRRLRLDTPRYLCGLGNAVVRCTAAEGSGLRPTTYVGCLGKTRLPAPPTIPRSDCPVTASQDVTSRDWRRRPTMFTREEICFDGFGAAVTCRATYELSRELMRDESRDCGDRSLARTALSGCRTVATGIVRCKLANGTTLDCADLPAASPERLQHCAKPPDPCNVTLGPSKLVGSPGATRSGPRLGRWPLGTFNPAPGNPGLNPDDAEVAQFVQNEGADALLHCDAQALSTGDQTLFGAFAQTNVVQLIMEDEDGDSVPVATVAGDSSAGDDLTAQEEEEIGLFMQSVPEGTNVAVTVDTTPTPGSAAPGQIALDSSSASGGHQHFAFSLPHDASLGAITTFFELNAAHFNVSPDFLASLASLQTATPANLAAAAAAYTPSTVASAAANDAQSPIFETFGLAHAFPLPADADTRLELLAGVRGARRQRRANGLAAFRGPPLTTAKGRAQYTRAVMINLLNLGVAKSGPELEYQRVAWEQEIAELMQAPPPNCKDAPPGGGGSGRGPGRGGGRGGDRGCPLGMVGA